MGCLNTGRKGKEIYIESDFQEDCDLRNFEMEIGGQSVYFNRVLETLCLHKDHIPVDIVDNVILKEFDPKLRKALYVDYFIKYINGVKYYDERKLRIFLFLFTQESLVVGKNEYYDKVVLSYLGKLFL
jgi:hypothetical protein